MVKGVFVLVTANTCPHCRKFKTEYWPTLKQILTTDTRISNVVEINLNTVNDPIPSAYPRDLPNWVAYYPTILLFTENSWRSNGTLEGAIFGSRKTATGIIDEMDTPKRDVKGVKEWVDKQFNTNPLFSDDKVTTKKTVANSITLQPLTNPRNIKYVYKRK